jgi:hypothetical protein
MGGPRADGLHNIDASLAVILHRLGWPGDVNHDVPGAMRAGFTICWIFNGTDAPGCRRELIEPARPPRSVTSSPAGQSMRTVPQRAGSCGSGTGHRLAGGVLRTIVLDQNGNQIPMPPDRLICWRMLGTKQRRLRSMQEGRQAGFSFKAS